MIRFTQDGSAVHVVVTAGYPISTWEYTFKVECNSKAYAALLAHNLTEKLEQTIRQIKRQAYNAGYADGRAKRQKQSTFWVAMKPDTRCSDGKERT